jgi:hypothetical protein
LRAAGLFPALLFRKAEAKSIEAGTPNFLRSLTATEANRFKNAVAFDWFTSCGRTWGSLFAAASPNVVSLGSAGILCAVFPFPKVRQYNSSRARENQFVLIMFQFMGIKTFHDLDIL